MGVFIWISVKEMLRKRLFIITIIVTGLYLALYGTTLQYAQNSLAASENVVLKAVLVPQILTAGLYFSSLLVAVFAIFATVAMISGEIESGIIHTIVSGPISRTQIVLGKFGGVSIVVALYAVALFSGIVMLVRFLTGQGIQAYWSGLATFTLLPIFLVGVTIAGSTILPTTANGITIFTLYALSLIGGVVEQIGTITENSTLLNMGILSSLVMPVDSIYRLVTSLVIDVENNPLAGLIMIGPFGAQTMPSPWMMLYTLIYLLIALTAAVVAFKYRDI